jgi:hypothetical protein
MSVSPNKSPSGPLAGADGYTLVELLVGMVLALLVSLGAFSFLEFTTSDVSRITERVHVDQAGRVALENLMLKLHSSCVVDKVTPILSKSSATSLRFVSEHGESPAFETVGIHEILYTPKSGTAQGTLVEKVWRSEKSTAPPYKFNEAATPTTTRLLTGVSPTTDPVTNEPVPVFRYYSYWEQGEPGAVLGELNPTPLKGALLPEALSEAQAEEVAKVSVSFTLAPEGAEAASFNHDRPVALEDSAVLRLTPASSAAGVTNLPCSQT